VSPVLWRRKADNEHSNPLFYGPSPLNSQHLHFQFPIASLLKIFVRSRRDWEKKFREGSRQVCTQKRIFQKEIKSTLNQELMHILGERGGYLVRVMIIQSLDAPKSNLETEKKPKNSLFRANI
jgi:hypothetical protein